MPKILIIGTGSAGKRHARNLRELDCTVACFDPRADRVDEAEDEGPLCGKYTDLNVALKEKWDGVVVASPPNFHVDQIFDVLNSQECPVLSEKPLSIDSESAARLLPHSDRILLGYTYRWWEPLRLFRKLLDEGEIGTLRNMRFIMSAHLADWHPWEPYQDFFMSQKENGGGALLDESHFIDLMLWMGIKVESVSAFVDKISDLDMDADDNVDIIIRSPNGARANLHLDLIGRPHERSITAIGEKGTLIYSYEKNEILKGDTGESKWGTRTFEGERNDMFMGVAREYLQMIEGKLDHKSCSVEDGVAALKVVDACRESSASGKHISIG